MEADRFDRIARILAVAISRREILGFAGGGLSGLGFQAAADAKKKGKKKKKKKPAPLGCAPACGTGFTCVETQCQCASGQTCQDGTICCGASTDQCNAANACCSPQPDATTCQGKCGSVDNNCDRQVNCGGCVQPAICVQNVCCTPDAPTATCAGNTCGPIENNCGQDVPCGDCTNGFTCSDLNSGGVCECASGKTCDGGAVCCGASTDVCDTADDCCTPESQNQTCQGKCGATINNCGQEIPCPDCSAGFVCSNVVDGGICECPAMRVVCDGHCCAAGQVCAADSMECSPAYKFETQWGGLSNCVQPDCSASPQFDGKFRQPSDLAFDADDNVYVVDWGNQRVQKFTSGGAFITKFGETDLQDPDGGNDNFSGPYGIEMAADGVIHVADYAFQRIQRWVQNDDNEFQYDWDGNWAPGPDDPNDPGDPGPFNQPLFIAQDSAGNFYVTDSHKHRVLKFNSDGTQHLLGWGGLSECGGSGQPSCSDPQFNGKFKFPYGIAVDSNDHVFVVDIGNHRVQKFDSNGNFITKWGSAGDLPGLFLAPQGIAVDSFDDVYVADTNNHRIQKFTQDSVDPLQYNWVTQIGTTGTFGDAPGQFRAPVGVGLDSVDNLYVADTYNHRIQKFAPVEEAAPLRQGGRVGIERKDRPANRGPAHRTIRQWSTGKRSRRNRPDRTRTRRRGRAQERTQRGRER